MPECMPMPPTEGDLVDLIRSLASGKDVRAFVEDVPWVTGARVSPASTGKLHRNVGVLHGALLTMTVPIVRVPPREWQAPLHLGTRRDSGSTVIWKNKLKAEAQRRFPHLKVTLATADALLILDWAAVRNTPSNPGPIE